MHKNKKYIVEILVETKYVKIFDSEKDADYFTNKVSLGKITSKDLEGFQKQHNVVNVKQKRTKKVNDGGNIIPKGNKRSH